MILVTGATGNVGRAVVEQLVAAGAQVRALSRHPERSSWPDGVEAVAGDLASGVPADVFAGVSGLHLFPVRDQLPLVLGAARAAGVQHVTVLSSLAVSMGERSPLVGRHLDVERAVAASGLGWTHLRPGMFMTNTLQWAPSIRSAGVVRQPYPDATAAPVHEADIAAVAVAALLDPPRHTGRVYELSGPEALTQLDRVEILAEVTGREVRFDEQTRDEAKAEMMASSAWMTEQLADSLLDLMASTRGVTDGVVLPGVQQATGRPARSFASWVADHRDAFDG
jgi:uncharacterized protein YbjT (DUF2867 family)